MTSKTFDIRENLIFLNLHGDERKYLTDYMDSLTDCIFEALNRECFNIYHNTIDLETANKDLKEFLIKMVSKIKREIFVKSFGVFFDDFVVEEWTQVTAKAFYVQLTDDYFTTFREKRPLRHMTFRNEAHQQIIIPFISIFTDRAESQGWFNITMRVSHISGDNGTIHAYSNVTLTKIPT